jgi:hypothetical protein
MKKEKEQALSVQILFIPISSKSANVDNEEDQAADPWLLTELRTALVLRKDRDRKASPAKPPMQYHLHWLHMTGLLHAGPPTITIVPETQQHSASYTFDVMKAGCRVSNVGGLGRKTGQLRIGRETSLKQNLRTGENTSG